jgi:hypothetical protein
MDILATIMTGLASGAVAGYLTFLLEAKKLQKEYQLQDNAERVVRDLLNHTEWKLRSFKVIQHHLGGFTDAELRKLLVRAGAIRFKSKSGHELWGLLDRNRHRLAIARIDQDPANFGGEDLFGGERSS